jgi:hypothetical protein
MFIFKWVYFTSKGRSVGKKSVCLIKRHAVKPHEKVRLRLQELLTPPRSDVQ